MYRSVASVVVSQYATRENSTTFNANIVFGVNSKHILIQSW